MNQLKLLKLLEDHKEAGVLSTADESGQVNAAVFGSLRCLDAEHVALVFGECRTLTNLRINGQAVYLFYQPGKTVLDWQGGRIYLEAVRFEKSGELFNNLVAEAEEKAGKMAASQLRQAVVFRISEVRPLIDFSS